LSPGVRHSALAAAGREALAGGDRLVQTVSTGRGRLGSFCEHRHCSRARRVRQRPSRDRPVCTDRIAVHYGLPFRGGGAMTSCSRSTRRRRTKAAMTLGRRFSPARNFVIAIAGWLEWGAAPVRESSSSTVECCGCAPRLFSTLQISKRRRRLTARTRSGAGRPFRRVDTLGAVPRMLSTGRCCRRRELRAMVGLGGRTPRRGRTTYGKRHSESTRSPALNKGMKDALKSYVDRGERAWR